MAGPRTILHADMDAFYAAIEQRDRPELRGKPVIVGGDGPRQVVSTCSYEAREFGVHSAMPGVRARRLCPQGIFVTPRMDVYAAVAAEVHAVFARFTDLVEPLSLDEAFLDVTGSRALFGDGPTIAARLKREVFDTTRLRVSVGVATSKYVAKVASDLRKPDGLVVVPPGTELEFLAPLPISRLWGIGKKSQPVLERAGLRTIGDVQRRTRDELVFDFGDHLGEHLFVLANGLDRRAVESERAARSISHEMTFAEDLVARDDVLALLLQLSEMVGRRLRQHELRGRVVRLKLRRPNFETLTRQRKLAAATADDLEIYRVIRELLDGCWPGRPGVRLLGVGVAELTSAAAAAAVPVQGSLFAAPAHDAAAGGRRDKVLRAMDAIRDRHGEGAVRHGGERRSTNPWGPD
ncbi:MAG: DNA polymerase IV [Planctomycetes bacterium]|nr:DNA polymerase IV [Planctomycetota bacterium]